MQALGTLKRKQTDGRCLPCFTLERAAACVEPHGHLSIAGSVVTGTGERQEFTCTACGQRMVRFLAAQTTPRPSNVWRYEGTPGALAPSEIIVLHGSTESGSSEKSQLTCDDESELDGETWF